MNDVLKDLWDAQEDYNSLIQIEADNYDPEYWTEKYLLGMAAEFDEILQHIQWKRHRKMSGREPDLTNLGYELADMVKYIFSLWQIWGFDHNDMLGYVAHKNFILQMEHLWDFSILPYNQKVIISDIDGTLGDWRATFVDWLSKTKNIILDFDDPETSLLLDNDFQLHHPEYIELKEEFERTGGFSNILPYNDAISTIQCMKANKDVYFVAVTARPHKTYHRIWMDTWNWLCGHKIKPDRLYFKDNSRVLLAEEFKNGGDNEVILFEDNPGLILRAANSGIKVFARRHPYNESIKHKNVILTDQYTNFYDYEFFA